MQKINKQENKSGIYPYIKTSLGSNERITAHSPLARFNKPDKPLYPMRINKYLAGKGYATRTGVDEMIKNNMVMINGRVAVLGDKILETDIVNVKSAKKPKKYEYFAYN